MGTGSASPRRRKISTSAQCSMAEAGPKGARGPCGPITWLTSKLPLAFSPGDPQRAILRTESPCFPRRKGYCSQTLSLPPKVKGL